MPNTIKYSTSAQTLALKQGNYWIGTGDVDKGPTSTTDYWNGITPPSGGYTIYLNKASNGPSIYVAANDSELISLTNTIAGASYTTVAQCFNYFRSQNDKMVFNRDYEPIVTNGLVLCLDAGFRPSYTTSGTTWYDLTSNAYNGTLINGPTFSSANGGSIDFDGTDDYVNCGVINNTQELTVAGWFLHPETTFVTYNALISKDLGGPNTNRIYQISLASGKLQQHINNPIGAIITADTAIPTNTWLYYTYTSTASGNLGRLYQNAVSVGTGVAINASSASIPLLLHVYNGNGVSGRIRIAITQVYNRALSAAEILQNYNAQKARFGL